MEQIKSKLYILVCLIVFICLGCNKNGAKLGNQTSDPLNNSSETLVEARKNFQTKIINSGDDVGPPDQPDGKVFELIRYQSPAGKLAAYLTPDSNDGKKHPAIVWITGGDNNSIGDVWSDYDRTNDQSATAFRKAGIVMMFPSQRGGNDNPGKREGFFGEVDDILAAREHLAKLPYVDPQQIYLGGHSTGGTLAMLVGESTDQFKAVFALGPVASPAQYGGSYMYCNVNDQKEIKMRSPIEWLHCVKSPMYVIEGANQGNWDGSIDIMAQQNKNEKIQFLRVPRHDHFSVIGPVTEILARQIVAGKIELTKAMVNNLR